MTQGMRWLEHCLKNDNFTSSHAGTAASRLLLLHDEQGAECVLQRKSNSLRNKKRASSRHAQVTLIG